MASVRDHREKLDNEVWRAEVLAQKHEKVFVQLWDRLRATEHRMEVLTEVPFEQIALGKLAGHEDGAWGIRHVFFEPSGTPVRREEWTAYVARMKENGYRLVQSEWHHAAFDPEGERGPRSTIAFKLDLTHDAQLARLAVKGDLEVQWKPSGEEEDPEIASLNLRKARITTYKGPPAFEELDLVDAEDSKLAGGDLSCLLVYDLDKDRRPEIILPGRNAVYWNRGAWKFEVGPLVADPGDRPFYNAILADFNGDAEVDLFAVVHDGMPLLYPGTPGGRFPDAPHPVEAAGTLHLPCAPSAGDVDEDGDLDLWVGQYRSAYREGKFPEPYYDSNDGLPACLLINDGKGRFTDETEQRGLGPKRFRRTFSASLADLDGDRNLDLLTVNDYAGIDLYRNEGNGTFTDVSNSWADERHNFGMSHTFADYDLDGELDFFVTGMASTTARRLEHLGLGRSEFPAHQEMRMKMAYGNRMYVRKDGRYLEPSFRDDVNRSGWSWGSSSFDFDNDADPDLFVANGYLSGKTTQDYCTEFWRHDIYVDPAQPKDALLKFHSEQMTNLFPQLSWNGYEHNCLFMNQEGTGFQEVGWVMGVAGEFDSRSIVGADLDLDGKVDLCVIEMNALREEATLHVYANRLSNGNHWIGVQLQEEGAGASPLGATVRLHAGGRTQTAQFLTGESYYSQHPNMKHFGLGKTEQVESLEVIWRDGSRQRLERPAPNQYHLIRRNPAPTAGAGRINPADSPPR